MRSIWERITRLYPLSEFKCLQIAEDPDILPEWFGEYYLSVYGGKNSMDIQDIPLPDGALDVVVCNHVLEHVAKDGKAMQELMRNQSCPVINCCLPNLVA